MVHAKDDKASFALSVACEGEEQLGGQRIVHTWYLRQRSFVTGAVIIQDDRASTCQDLHMTGFQGAAG